MKPNFLKRLWCFITCGCDMQPKNFLSEAELKMLFTMDFDVEKAFGYFKRMPYFECSKCGRVVK